MPTVNNLLRCFIVGLPLVVITGCQPQTEERVVGITTAAEANKTATNGPTDTVAGMNKFWEALGKTEFLKELVKSIEVKPGSDVAIMKLDSAMWERLSPDTRQEIVKSLQEIWALSNSPADPDKCPVSIISDKGKPIASSSSPTATSVVLN